MKFFGRCSPIKLTKIIADMTWVHYDYPRRFIIVKPKNQEEVNHKIYQAAKIWIDYHVTNSKKKYRPSLQVDHLQVLL